MRRSKLLPSGGALTDAARRDLARQVTNAVRAARHLGRLQRTPQAEERWAELYVEMAENDPGGLVGAVTARAEAQTLRLSVAYAILDASPVISVDHLEAGYAVWQYAESSARYLFGDSLGDEVADRLLSALRLAGSAGMDGTSQRDLFGRHVAGQRLEQARRLLEEQRLAVTKTEPTAGRPRTVTYASECATEATWATEAPLSSPRAHRSQPEYVNLPLDEVGRCRECDAVATMRDEHGPICRSHRDAA